MSAPPAFQFYPDDFLGGVSDMTQEEVGAYILLLCHQWNRGSIPVQPDRQKLLAKGNVTDYVLAKFREEENGLLKNQRMELERIKQAKYREAQRVKGKKGGESRQAGAKPGLSRGLAGLPTEGQPKPSSPSPSPSPSSVSDLRSPVSILLRALGELYGRNNGSPASYAEEHAAAIVVKRTGWDFELVTIAAWFNAQTSEDRKFRPALARLLEDWQTNLDRAKNNKPAPVKRWGTKGFA